MTEVTRLLTSMQPGDPHAAEQLLPLVYQELRQLAAKFLAQEKPGQTFQPTALVHEAYLRLLDGRQTRCYANRGHFFAAAAEAMRRILIDRARSKQSRKHGGDRQRLPLEPACLPDTADDARSDELLALDDALQQLERVEPSKAHLVKLRYYAGLSQSEAAEVMGISPRTARRYWLFARAWLFKQIQGK